MTKIKKAIGIASEWVQSVKANVGGGLGTAEEFVRKHPVTSAVTLGGGVLAGGAVTQIVRKRIKKRAKNKKSYVRTRPKRKKPLKRKRKPAKRIRRKQKQPYTAGKRRDTSTRRIRYTKNNQPYVILKSGKARFIKRSSVRRMRKLKGGKY